MNVPKQKMSCYCRNCVYEGNPLLSKYDYSRNTSKTSGASSIMQYCHVNCTTYEILTLSVMSRLAPILISIRSILALPCRAAAMSAAIPSWQCRKREEDNLLMEGYGFMLFWLSHIGMVRTYTPCLSLNIITRPLVANMHPPYQYYPL